jgi:C4-dicarboxylate-specific signal transduction histidine kinase
VNDLVFGQQQKMKPTDPQNVEIVDARPVLERVQSSVSARFPGVRHVMAMGESKFVRLPLRGGAPTLHRVVENLLINACEGDGQRGARSVEVSVTTELAEGRLRLSVRDDGPGFSAEQLSQGPKPFGTTKPNGTGLGLFTSERLVHACGGAMKRSNRPEGGAEVTIYLPLGTEKEASTPTRPEDG